MDSSSNLNQFNYQELEWTSLLIPPPIFLWSSLTTFDPEGPPTYKTHIKHNQYLKTIKTR